MNYISNRAPSKAIRLFQTSLRARLFLSLLPLIAVFLAFGIGTVTVFTRLSTRVNEAVTENNRSLDAVRAINELLGDLARDPMEATADGSENGSYALHARQLGVEISLLTKRFPLPGERDLVAQLVEQYNNLRDASSQSGAGARPGGDLRDQGLLMRIAQMRALLEKIRGLNYDAILEANRDIQTESGRITNLLIAGLVGFVLIAAASCYWMGRSVLRPIQSLTLATRLLSDGIFDQPIPILTRDELGVLAVAFNKMAVLLQEYRRSTTEKIVRIHRTMESTLGAFPDPVFVLNKLREIDLKNPAANKFSDSLKLTHRLPDRLQAMAESVLDGGKDILPEKFDEGLTFSIDGEERFFLPRVLAIKDKLGEAFGVAVVLHDLTRFRLLDAAKTNLVATVSHELKSPLTSVRMAVHLLLEKKIGALTEKQEQLLQAARDDSEGLLRILNDLLDLARLEEGDAELRLEPVAPAELVHQVSTEMSDRAAAKGIHLNCVAEAQLPAVTVDRQRISHVFSNLMTNAIKYSPPNDEIVVEAQRDGEDGVLFSVTDHGTGIDPQFQARVFDRFFRVPGQEKTGAGLGLSIAREITVAHGGRIGVRSAPGRGTTFYVVLKATS